jgi:3-oxoacid CoA-transferase subunit A
VRILASAVDAVSIIGSGASVAVGGFGLCGTPEDLLAALLRTDASELHIITNNCGPSGSRLTRLLETGRVRKVTASYIGDNKHFLARYTDGSIEVELVPQGTLAERLRCGGSGVPAFYTPTGVGTDVEFGGIPLTHSVDGTVSSRSEPRRTEVINGVRCVLEYGIRADVALIRAETSDRLGNLRFRGTARNFNPLCAMAGKEVIAEVQQVVEVGALDPDDVHLPCVFVSQVVDLNGRMVKSLERTGAAPAAPRSGGR